MYAWAQNENAGLVIFMLVNYTANINGNDDDGIDRRRMIINIENTDKLSNDIISELLEAAIENVDSIDNERYLNLEIDSIDNNDNLDGAVGQLDVVLDARFFESDMLDEFESISVVNNIETTIEEGLQDRWNDTGVRVIMTTQRQTFTSGSGGDGSNSNSAIVDLIGDIPLWVIIAAGAGLLALMLFCTIVILNIAKKRKERHKEKKGYNEADLRARNASVDNTLVYGHGISTFHDNNHNNINYNNNARFAAVGSLSASPVGSVSGSPRSGVGGAFDFAMHAVETNVEMAFTNDGVRADKDVAIAIAASERNINTPGGLQLQVPKINLNLNTTTIGSVGNDEYDHNKIDENEANDVTTPRLAGTLDNFNFVDPDIDGGMETNINPIAMQTNPIAVGEGEFDSGDDELYNDDDKQTAGETAFGGNYGLTPIGNDDMNDNDNDKDDDDDDEPSMEM